MTDDRNQKDKVQNNSRVGYRSPPEHGKIRQGEIRNPAGRPIGSRNRPTFASDNDLRKIIIEESQRMVTLNDPSGPISVKTAQAIIRATNFAAIKGNAAAQKQSADLLLRAQAQIQFESEKEIATAIEYKKQFDVYERRRKHTGEPALLPHGDHVEIDLARGCVHIRGPATPQEEKSWRRWERIRYEFLQHLSLLQKELKVASNNDLPALQSEIDEFEATLVIVGHALKGNRDAMALIEETYDSKLMTSPCIRDFDRRISAPAKPLKKRRSHAGK